MTNLEKYNDIFINRFQPNGIPLEQLTYQSVQLWDSVGHMGLIAELEELFDIMMDTDDIIDFSSYEKGKEILKNMASPSNLLKGKTAIITGSNRGIGKAIVERFADNGADIIACARKDSEEFKAYVLQISNKFKVKIDPVYFDLSDEDRIKEAFKFLYKDKIKIDILVNNAGIHHKGLLQMTPLEKIREVFEVNFLDI